MSAKIINRLTVGAAAAALALSAGIAFAQQPAPAQGRGGAAPAPGAAPQGAPARGGGAAQPGGGGRGPATPPSPGNIGPTPAVLEAFNKAGPNKVIRAVEAGPNCTIFRPETLTAGTPIVLWANGRDQSPTGYGQMLDQVASYGFVVAATNAPRSGAGVEPLACLDWLTTQSKTSGSPYSGKLNLSKVGAAGHSQGGGSVLMAARDPRVKTAVGVQAYTNAGLGFEVVGQEKAHGPILMLSGGADTVAAPTPHQERIYENAPHGVVWATLAGATHNAPAIGDSSQYRPVLTAWMLAQLKNDARASAVFRGSNCGLCTASGWTVKKRGV